MDANLYFDKLDFTSHLPRTDCGDCGETTCAALAGRIRTRSLAATACPHLTAHEATLFAVVLELEEQLHSAVEVLQVPRATPAMLHELNEPGADAPLLVTGNSESTLETLQPILATTVSPFRLLQVETRGDTVDMALIFNRFAPACLAQTIGPLIDGLGPRATVILPGIAAAIATELSTLLGREVLVGPYCAAELPLFLGERWQLSG